MFSPIEMHVFSASLIHLHCACVALPVVLRLPNALGFSAVFDKTVISISTTGRLFAIRIQKNYVPLPVAIFVVYFTSVTFFSSLCVMAE
jgi:hypothetical protein